MKGPIELAPGVYGLGTDIVNWYLVADDEGLTAVDAGLPGYASSLEEDLRAIGRAPGDVAAVVLTHADADHTGLAPVFQAAGARVLVHSADVGLLRKPGSKGGDARPRKLLPNLLRPPILKIGAHMTRYGARPAKVEGAETFAGGDVLDVPGRPRAIHTPGHTAGHCALLFERQRALFAGDALCTHPLFTGGRGAVTLPPRFFNEDTATATASLGKIEALDADVVLFGHGEPWRDGPRAAVERARAAS